MRILPPLTLVNIPIRAATQLSLTRAGVKGSLPDETIEEE
jgi:hypothetical protein